MSTRCQMLKETYGDKKLWIMQHKTQFDYLGEDIDCMTKKEQSGMITLWESNW